MQCIHSPGLLLSYLGTASDVVDFFSVLAEEKTLLTDLAFVFTILSIWSWSMVQFMFVVTMTKSDQQTQITINNRVSPEAETTTSPLQPGHSQSDTSITIEREAMTSSPKSGLAKGRSLCHGFVESEMWSIFVSVVLQDGPYVIVRLACVFYWNIRTYTNYFFTAKNCMMLALQVYRIVAVYQKYAEDAKLKKETLGKTL